MDSAGWPFTKGHGTGNDFVVLPDLDAALSPSAAFVRAVCDRRTGVGADGLLRVAPAAEGARWFMDYRNADGSVAEMCGNGIRVFARYLVDRGLAEPGEWPVATRDGLKTVRVPAAGDVTVDMGPARLGGPATIGYAGEDLAAVAVSMGNPHAVVRAPAPLDTLDLAAAPVVPGSAYPTGANVEFVEQVTDRHVRMRVHERGVGETASCGTGACAAAVAVLAARGEHGEMVVDVRGGRLVVDWRADGSVLLTGPAVLVADGRLRPDWLVGVDG